LKQLRVFELSTFQKSLNNFEKIHPDKKDYTWRATALIEAFNDNTPFLRTCFNDGHFTGSMLVINTQKTKVLLMHHVKLWTWQQFWWHADGDTDLRNVAIRELEEESWIDISQTEIGDDILYIDIHKIPPYKSEPEHYHYDIWYLTIVDENISFSKRDEEVHEIKWFDIENVRQQKESWKFSSGLVNMLENI